ncbi:MAG: glycosyltransferase family 4 protein [Candidatus Glassbacteria bacterium]|nr:glycosyltransferase family 4 protein [Candidatus Glassbacteria bacterium]
MPGKKKIAFIGPVVWGSVWGHGPELARYLSERDKVVYFDPLVPPAAQKSSFIDRDSYRRPAEMKLVRRKCRFRPGLLYGLCMELCNLWAVVRCGADAIVTYYPAGTLLALLWCRLRGKRSLFIYADSSAIIASPLARRAAGFGLGLSARLASAGCIATSGPLLEDIRRYTRRAELIPNGVDLGRLERPGQTAEKDEEAKKFTVAFAGAFGEWVDVELIIETAASCGWAGFVLIGDGPRLQDARGLAAGLNNVELTGALPHSEVFSRLAEADVCLVPFAVNELTDRVCPVKLFEYWAMGKPVVATPCRELKRLAGEHPGSLYLAENSSSTTKLLERFSNQPELRASSSRAAKAAVKDYDWRELGARIRDMLFAGNASVSDNDSRGADSV